MQIPYPELVKLFDFLDSDTPSSKIWVQRYLTKHGIGLSLHTYQVPLKQYATEQVRQLGLTHTDIKLFAQRMGNAWRTRKHRQKKDVVSLSVSIEKSVADHLSIMSKGRKKADVVSMLIQNNFQAFLVEENLRKDKRAEEKRILKMQCSHAFHEKLLNRPPTETTQVVSQAIQAEEFKEAIAQLYDIIFSANERCEAIDDQTLIQATKIYYAAFNK
jgi:hypothetical protein